MIVAAAQLPSRFERSFEGRPSELEGVLQAFEDWAAACAVPARARRNMRLMLDELITNVMVHGYAQGEPQGVSLAAEREGDALRAVLTDHAFAYDPLRTPPPDVTSGIEERTVGGLGVHFVRSLADELEYERVEVAGRGANRLRIVLRFAG